jgi:membrane-associated protease RseP (regulator of RpoE activity)
LNQLGSKILLFLIALTLPATVFADQKSACDKNDRKSPEHYRGWIGGEYKLVRRHWNWFMSTDSVVGFPKSLTTTEKKGLLITAVGTNTPAYFAGLREGDLILELDHARITSFADFRRKIDEMKPGASLAVRAFRNEDVQEFQVTIGQETYRNNGDVAVSFLPILAEPNLKFNPGFSLIALGLSWDKGKRAELGSAKQVYIRDCRGEKYRLSNRRWRAWAGVILAEGFDEILAQEVVAR